MLLQKGTNIHHIVKQAVQTVLIIKQIYNIEQISSQREVKLKIEEPGKVWTASSPSNALMW